MTNMINDYNKLATHSAAPEVVRETVNLCMTTPSGVPTNGTDSLKRKADSDVDGQPVPKKQRLSSDSVAGEERHRVDGLVAEATSSCKRKADSDVDGQPVPKKQRVSSDSVAGEERHRVDGRVAEAPSSHKRKADSGVDGQPVPKKQRVSSDSVAGEERRRVDGIVPKATSSRKSKKKRRPRRFGRPIRAPSQFYQRLGGRINCKARQPRDWTPALDIETICEGEKEDEDETVCFLPRNLGAAHRAKSRQVNMKKFDPVPCCMREHFHMIANDQSRLLPSYVLAPAVTGETVDFAMVEASGNEDVTAAADSGMERAVDLATVEASGNGVVTAAAASGMKGAVNCCFFDSFLSNMSIDGKGRAVRRSPRLCGMAGSYYVPSGNGRSLRRSCRTRP